MRKVKCLFVVNRDIQMATRQLEESCEWVVKGEGQAFIKYDGTPALFENGILYKRWNRKLKKKFIKKWFSDKENFEYNLDMFVDVPEGAIQLEELPAKVSLHFPYWVPVGNDHSDRFFLEAFNKLETKEEGTYELIGKTIQGNIYGLDGHELISHKSEEIIINDYSFDGLRNLFSKLNAEGIVWHHPDGRMAKLRRSHFNFKWRDDIRNDAQERANFVA